MKHLTLVLITLLSAITTQAQTAISPKTKKSLAAVLQQIGISNTDTMTAGNHAYKVLNHKVILRISEDKVPVHVGIPLFPKNMRSQMPSPVYDFLEYALLKKALKLPGDEVRINSITFTHGGWADLLNVTDEMLCTIGNSMGRLYEVSWYNADKLIASATFPIQYDMLMLSNKEELENLLLADLRSTQGILSDYSIKTPAHDTFSKEYTNKEVCMVKGDTYINNSIATNLFYRKRGQTYKLFSSSKYPAESLANILLRADKALPKATVTLKVVKYDGSIETIETTMADWLRCMQGYDCNCYYGFDKEVNGKATAVVYASNPKAGYDHVLMLECDIDQLDTPSVHLKGTAYLFSPTSNVRNLFYKYKKK